MSKPTKFKKPKPPLPHVFKRMVCHWPACIHCGLILLKTDATRKAASKPCPSYDD